MNDLHHFVRGTSVGASVVQRREADRIDLASWPTPFVCLMLFGLQPELELRLGGRRGRAERRSGAARETGEKLLLFADAGQRHTNVLRRRELG
jgi:hypothetical protein